MNEPLMGRETYLDENFRVYGLQVLEVNYSSEVPRPRYKLSVPRECKEREIQNDLELFKKRQEAIYSRDYPVQGDFVRVDGELYEISVTRGHLQVTKSHGSIYIGPLGNTSRSGSCIDFPEVVRPELEDLVDSGEYHPQHCWIFSQDQTGAHRGVYNYLSFKVWLAE